MLRDDIDAVTLAWTDKWESETAITLEAEMVDNKYAKYWVRIISIDGNIATQTRYDSLHQALLKYVEALPPNA